MQEVDAMIKIKWDLSEAVALFATYMEEGATLSVSTEKLMLLSEMYKRKAKEAGLNVDEKFRNLSGLKMQLGCIHYVVTNGSEGMSNASRIFYEAYDLYRNNPAAFTQIKKDFFKKYAAD